MNSLESHDCQVVDITQFLLEGMLVFTFNLDVGEGSSFKLMKDLRHCSDALGMDLDFHFPDAEPTRFAIDRDVEKKAIVTIGSTKSISASALCDVDTVLCRSGCVIEEIE